MKRVLIVGCGYLGRRVAALWQSGGWEVHATTRSPERAEEWRAFGWHPIVMNVTQPQAWEAGPEFDVCLYAVGYDRTSTESKAAVAITGLENVVQSVGTRCRRLISISSSSVYGQDAGECVDAYSPCSPQAESGKVCLEAEAALQRILETQPHIFPEGAQVLRLSGIYGPQRLLTRVDQLRSGQPLGGRGDAWLNLIHVDDAAAAVVQIAAAPISQWVRRCSRWLLSDLEPVRRQEFYGALARLVEAPDPTFDSQLPTRNGQGGLGKKCSSVHMREHFGLSLRFPTFREGLVDAVKRTR